MNHSQITAFLWSIADLIGHIVKRGKYQGRVCSPTQ
jgi:hypothetical protein